MRMHWGGESARNHPQRLWQYAYPFRSHVRSDSASRALPLGDTTWWLRGSAVSRNVARSPKAGGHPYTLQPRPSPVGLISSILAHIAETCPGVGEEPTTSPTWWHGRNPARSRRHEAGHPERSAAPGRCGQQWRFSSKTGDNLRCFHAGIRRPLRAGQVIDLIRAVRPACQYCPPPPATRPVEELRWQELRQSRGGGGRAGKPSQSPE
jgi:hypothetical protein